MNDVVIWKFIKGSIEKDGKAILTVVVKSEGSSPGKAGFKIAVSKTGNFVGTIGGGEMEFNLLENCKKYYLTNVKINSLQKLFHNTKVKKQKSGLICAGSQTNYTCTLNKVDLSIINKIIKSYGDYKKGSFILTPDGIAFSRFSNEQQNINFTYNSETDWRYEEIIGIRETIYIVGGGHVGLALSRQMKLLNFYVIVFDNRKDVKTIVENNYADKIKICSYNDIGKFIREGINSYAAIVTSSYPSDLNAIKSIINKKLKYIGLMGSRAKIKKIFDELNASGFKPNQLKMIHAPIGIEINSETVEEIAVSIAAEIISIKNS